MRQASNNDLLQSGQVTLPWIPQGSSSGDQAKIFAGPKYYDEGDYDLNAIDMTTAGIEAN